MTKPIALTEATYRDRRRDIERDLAYAETNLKDLSLLAVVADDPSIAAEAKAAVSQLKDLLATLELAREQSVELNATERDEQREAAKRDRAREAQDKFATAETRAGNMQRLLDKLIVEADLYVDATKQGMLLAHSLKDNSQPVSDMLRSFAFSSDPEAALIAAFIHRLAVKGVADINGRSVASDFADKAFDEVFRARYGAVLALIESVLTDDMKKAA